MTTVIHGPGTDADLQTLHEFLTARGWSPSEYATLDENGCPDTESGWIYRPSFGGVEMNRVDDATPDKLACAFTTDDDQLDFVIDSVGSGSAPGRTICEAHVVQKWRAPFDDGDELDLDELAEVLDRLESQARAMDPREFIECLFFGPCGRPD
ncbi:hypothetical protein [Nocardia sp. NPDC059228]|uniref:hypothetical protein n=1 Tax=Nocardia sp. NPDC059228 TaxID=3346777 RepID=UPI0036B0DD33